MGVWWGICYNQLLQLIPPPAGFLFLVIWILRSSASIHLLLNLWMENLWCNHQHNNQQKGSLFSFSVAGSRHLHTHCVRWSGKVWLTIRSLQRRIETSSQRTLRGQQPGKVLLTTRRLRHVKTSSRHVCTHCVRGRRPGRTNGDWEDQWGGWWQKVVNCLFTMCVKLLAKEENSKIVVIPTVACLPTLTCKLEVYLGSS